MEKDHVIFDLIGKEHERQCKGIELIASENFVSDQVMEAMGSCLTNKYAEVIPERDITAVARWWTRWNLWLSNVYASSLERSMPTCSPIPVPRPTQPYFWPV